MRFLPFTLIVAGCQTVGFWSEEHQFGFVDDALFVGAHETFDNTGPLLLGEAVCPRCVEAPDGACEAEDGQTLWQRCIDTEVVGAEEPSALCLSRSAPGEGTLTLTPRSCEVDGRSELVPDAVRFWWVEQGGLEARLRLWPEDALLDDAASPTAAGVRVGDGSDPAWGYAPGDTWRFVAGAPRVVSTVLTLSKGQRVAFEALSGHAVLTPLSDGEPHPFSQPDPTLVLAPGGTWRLDLVVRDEVFEGDVVLGVPGDEARSLELVPVWDLAGDGERPLGVRAVVRDGEGRPLLGAPVDWSLEGDDVVSETWKSSGGTVPDLPSDWIYLEDACVNPFRHEDGELTVGAAFEGLTAATTLTWVRVPPERRREWRRGEYCPEASCGCATADPRGGLGALLAAALLARRRRCRR